MGHWRRMSGECNAGRARPGTLIACLLGILVASLGARAQAPAAPAPAPQNPDKPAAAAPSQPAGQGTTPASNSAAPPAGQQEGQAAHKAPENAPELATQESRPTFRVRANLVLVRVVARDKNGQAVGNLRREDFRLFDNGKPQTITQFTVESPASKPAAETKPAKRESSSGVETEAAPAADAPQRFLGLFFDDVHLGFSDLAHARDAAGRYIDTMMQPGDRIGIFTSSGQNQLDFGDDRARIHQTLLALRSRPVLGRVPGACPDIDHYQAYQAIDQNDAMALEVAAREILHCNYRDDLRFINQARLQAQAEAQATLNTGEAEVNYSLRGIEQLIRVLSGLPGQRNVVLVSPGFFTLDNQFGVSEIIDRAVRSNVIVSALDARGLYTPEPFGDVSQDQVIVPAVDGIKAQLRLTGFRMNSDVMAELASATGGVFFENNNDLNAGFRRVGAFPEFSYILGFSPANQKIDGRFHTLKVTLAPPAKLTVQARRGYFAPKKALDEAAAAHQEIEEALFSQDELNEVPVDVHTQFFKSGDVDAKLSVLARVDVRFVHFRKEAGRNLDKLTVVAALFDRNGKFISAEQKTINLRLFDATRERLTRSGLSTKTSFDVKPGTYLVRLVLREDGGPSLSAQNRTVEIP